MACIKNGREFICCEAKKTINKVGSYFFSRLHTITFFKKWNWWISPLLAMRENLGYHTNFIYGQEILGSGPLTPPRYLLFIRQLFVIPVNHLEQLFGCHFWVLLTKLGPVLLQKHGICRRGFLRDLWVNLQKTKNKTRTHFTEHVKSVDCSCQQPSSTL